VPGDRHETAHQELLVQLCRLATEMGLKKNLRSMGSATRRSSNSSAEPDVSIFANGRANPPTVVIEVAVSQSLGSLKVKGALWCSKPGVRAVLLVRISQETITITKLVPKRQTTAARSGELLRPEVVAHVVVRPVRNTPQGTAYELDPDFDQAITLAYGDVTNEAAPAGGQQDFVLDGAFLREWAAEVLSV